LPGVSPETDQRQFYQQKEEHMRKKFFAAGAVLAACILVGQGAQAKTLEDILKEKGVITEADYKEVTKSKPIDYKLGKGFTFTSADEKFQLSLGGRMQFRYTYYDYDAPTSKDYSLWNAQRIRLVAQGYAYTKDLTYKMEIDPRVLAYGDDRARGGLLDCFVNYKVMDEVQFLLGQTKVKYGYSMIQSDATLMFVDRAPFITTLTPGYDIGAYAYGKFFNGIVDYALSVSTGDGQTNAATTNHNLFAARVAVSPLGAMANDEPDLAISKKPLFTIGGNYFFNTISNTYTAATATTFASITPESKAGFASLLAPQTPVAAATAGTYDINCYGVDAHFKWMGLSLQSEALFAQSERSSTSSKIRALGYYAQAGYMVTPQIGLAVRYSVYDPNRDRGNDLQTEQIGAVSYYFDKHNLKLQADVGNIHKQTGVNTRTDDMQYRFQAQLVF
jgi:phosphate-selective porin OprO and OprP